MLGTCTAVGEPGFEFLQRIPQVVLLARSSIALGIFRISIFLYLVEPDMLGARCRAAGGGRSVVAPGFLAEDEDRSLHAGIRLEDAARQRDNTLDHVLGQQLAAQADMSISSAEQHALRNDHCATAAHAQQVEHQPQEEQLALVGDAFILLLATTADTWEQQGIGLEVPTVHRAGEGGVGQDEVVGFRFQQSLDWTLTFALAECVTLQQMRVGHVMQHQVHPPDARHRAVVVQADEVGAVVNGFVLLTRGCGTVSTVRGTVPFKHYILLRRVLAHQVLLRTEEEAARAGRGVDNSLA
ncbi:hypothetical protein D3C87_1386840 [compost metagenome]